MMNDTVKMLRVIVCRPGEEAEPVEIPYTLEALRNLVGGTIQEWQPFHSESDDRCDDVAIVCNAEGNLMQMKTCRLILDENGLLLDMIVGPFFICYAPIYSEHYESLPSDLEEIFLKKFEDPEEFTSTYEGIQIVKYDPNEFSKQSQITPPENLTNLVAAAPRPLDKTPGEREYVRSKPQE